MFGDSANKKDDAKETKADDKKEPTATTTAPPNVQQLINRAAQEFEEYQRLNSQSKFGDAGKKLEDLKRTLEELKKGGGKP
jgi:hypothetical protein